MDIVSEEVNENMTKSKELEVEANPEPEIEPDPDAVATQATEEETTLQQLKAKKNKSNLFLIKSYSFIERANNNNNNNSNNSNTDDNGNGRAGSKVSSVSVPSADLLQSPDLQPFDNIESIFLAQATDKDDKDKDKGWSKKRAGRLKKPKKEKPPKQPKIKSKTNAKDKAKGDLAEPEEKLLRRKQPVFLPLPMPLTSTSRLHEYEEILETTATNGHGSLPRPQSLPAKVHFENAAATITTTTTTTAISKETGTVKRSSANIKRESFLRQSLQSIRRSFGSNKHSPKLAMALESPESPTAEAVICSRSSSSSAASTSSAVSCSSSSASSWSSTSAAINILSKAPGHNRRLDEIMPTPVVLLLNDDLMLQLQLDEIDGDGGDTLKR
ncbi:uncharacterized protein Dwil_GK19754 [Drosophila willistoni]|nr:uncharacterized protein Dwil_GK19754 [Drosophila willistoni]